MTFTDRTPFHIVNKHTCGTHTHNHSFRVACAAIACTRTSHAPKAQNRSKTTNAVTLHSSVAPKIAYKRPARRCHSERRWSRRSPHLHNLTLLPDPRPPHLPRTWLCLRRPHPTAAASPPDAAVHRPPRPPPHRILPPLECARLNHTCPHVASLPLLLLLLRLLLLLLRRRLAPLLPHLP